MYDSSSNLPHSNVLTSSIVQELPSREAVREVIDVADAFWADHPDEFIAIHCAYGAL